MIVTSLLTSMSSDLNAKSCTARYEFELLDSANSQNAVALYSEAVSKHRLPVVGGILNGFIVTSVRPQRSGAKSGMRNHKGQDCFVWNVSVECGGLEDNKETIGDWTISSSTEWEDISLPYDANGQLNKNSAGEWFTDALVYRMPIRVWKFSRKQNFNPENTARYFVGCLNLDTLWGCDPYTLLCRDFTYSHSQKTRYWDVNIDIACRADTWLVRKADCGFTCLFYGVPNRILNQDGSPIESPKLLDGAGGILNSDTPPVMKNYRVNALNRFGYLNLPNPFH